LGLLFGFVVYNVNLIWVEAELVLYMVDSGKYLTMFLVVDQTRLDSLANLGGLNSGLA